MNWYLYRWVSWNISEVINENSLSTFNYLEDFKWLQSLRLLLTQLFLTFRCVPWVKIKNTDIVLPLKAWFPFGPFCLLLLVFVFRSNEKPQRAMPCSNGNIHKQEAPKSIMGRWRKWKIRKRCQGSCSGAKYLAAKKFHFNFLVLSVQWLSLHGWKWKIHGLINSIHVFCDNHRDSCVPFQIIKSRTVRSNLVKPSPKPSFSLLQK